MFIIIKSTCFQLHVTCNFSEIINFPIFLLTSWGSFVNIILFFSCFIFFNFGIERCRCPTILLDQRHSFSPVPRYKPWESLWGSSATTPLVDFHHRLTACPSYLKRERNPALLTYYLKQAMLKMRSLPLKYNLPVLRGIRQFPRWHLQAETAFLIRSTFRSPGCL